MLKTIANGVVPGLLDRVWETRGRNQTPYVIFDLDDTLFMRRNRHMRILKEFADHVALTPDMREAVRLLMTHDETEGGWSIQAACHTAGCDPLALRKAMHEYWTHRYHKEDVQAEDGSVPGASEYIRALLCVRAEVIFITHREEKKRAETIAALERSGFPVPGAMPWNDRVRLVMKPDFEVPDLTFKLGIMQGLSGYGEILACVENDAGYLDAMVARFPEMTPVLLKLHHASKHAGKDPRILPIEDFLPREAVMA